MRREYVVGFVVLLVVMVALPSVLGRLALQRPEVDPEVVDGADNLPVRVYLPDQDVVETMPLGQYLKGVVAAEMPPDFHDQAIMAQMIVARTYTVRRMQPFAHPSYQSCHPEADLCADIQSSQAYMSYEALEQKYGRWVAQAYWQRLTEAQQATIGLVVLYQGELIDPLYHAVSGTKTVNSQEYFVKALPYLKAVEDGWGAHAPRLKETVRIPLAQLTASLFDPDAAIPVSTLSGNTISIAAKTTTGRVKTVSVAGVQFTGREFRERLGLRSSDFTVTLEDGEAVITTVGYGHGVGMSQYGADGMAQAGRSYRDILTHYYTDVTIGHLFQN